MSYFSPSRNKLLKAFAFAPQRPGGTTLLSTLAQLHRGPARMNHLHTHIQSANTIARYSLSKTHCSDHTAVSTAVLASTRTSTTDLPLSDEIRPESRAMWGDRFTSEACTPCGSTPSQLESAQTANSWLLAVTPTARCGLQTGHLGHGGVPEYHLADLCGISSMQLQIMCPDEMELIPPTERADGAKLEFRANG